MRLTIRILGVDVLQIDTGADEQQQERGDHTSYPVGFAVSPGDESIWQKGVER